jgi:hypothetical protein
MNAKVQQLIQSRSIEGALEGVVQSFEDTKEHGESQKIMEKHTRRTLCI